MKTIWFKRAGMLYLPVHFMGYFLTMVAIALMIPVCIGILRSGHSVTDDMFYSFIYITCTAFWWKWIAEKTSN